MLGENLCCLNGDFPVTTEEYRPRYVTTGNSGRHLQNIELYREHYLIETYLPFTQLPARTDSGET
jgi:hypothetical protein